MSQLFASADRAPATYTAEAYLSPDAGGALFYINYTAEGGASSTLDAKLQYYDAGEQAWDDLTDSAGNAIAFAQFTGVGEDSLKVYPGLTEKLTTTNRQYNGPLPRRLRLSATVGTTNVTFSAGFENLR